MAHTKVSFERKCELAIFIGLVSLSITRSIFQSIDFEAHDLV